MKALSQESGVRSQEPEFRSFRKRWALRIQSLYVPINATHSLFCSRRLPILTPDMVSSPCA
jgi:hypothetical protein